MNIYKCKKWNNITLLEILIFIFQKCNLNHRIAHTAAANNLASAFLTALPESCNTASDQSASPAPHTA